MCTQFRVKRIGATKMGLNVMFSLTPKSDEDPSYDTVTIKIPRRVKEPNVLLA